MTEQTAPVTQCQCEAIESDWLDISYTKRKYIDQNDQPAVQKRPLMLKLRKNLKYVVAVLLVVAAFAGMLLATTDNSITGTARLAYTSSLTAPNGLFSAKNNGNEVKLPATARVIAVDGNGTVSIGGGKVATCLVGGTVTQATADSVSVQTDEDTVMTYSNLTGVLVKVGDVLLQYDCIGKYVDSTFVNITHSDQAVTDVVGSTYSFIWNG